ncbi:ABC transporter permease [Kineococcus glutinatus]|uniref:ABC-2 family transporter protein n=1 Tax=Kineococcus glutinatus TaxID=1070872 RepID=A0ABP9I7M7_9ACTN
MPAGPYPALAVAGFRRWSAYRLATWTSATANVVFGLLKAAVVSATVGAAGGSVAGYDAAEATTFAWLSQALIAPVNLFARDDMAQRVRSGDVAVDLARPVDPQLAAWAGDLGRAAYQFLPRGVPPLLVGALVSGLVLPAAPAPYLLGAVSLVMAVSLSFACQWLVNLLAFRWLDVRGPLALYTVVSLVLTGLAVPVWWFPGWLRELALVTPFPSMLQAPVDVLTGRAAGTAALEVLGVQALWLAGALLAGHVGFRAGARRLVVQGG